MNKRLLLAFVLLVSINLDSMAQLLPIKNVPSPEIASLGESVTLICQGSCFMPNKPTYLETISPGTYTAEIHDFPNFSSISLRYSSFFFLNFSESGL